MLRKTGGAVEVFFERPTAQQRGFWIDHVPGRWLSVGLGWRVLCFARWWPQVARKLD